MKRAELRFSSPRGREGCPSWFEWPVLVGSSPTPATTKEDARGEQIQAEGGRAEARTCAAEGTAGRLLRNSEHCGAKVFPGKGGDVRDDDAVVSDYAHRSFAVHLQASSPRGMDEGAHRALPADGGGVGGAGEGRPETGASPEHQRVQRVLRRANARQGYGHDRDSLAEREYAGVDAGRVRLRGDQPCAPHGVGSRGAVRSLSVDISRCGACASERGIGCTPETSSRTRSTVAIGKMRLPPQTNWSRSVLHRVDSSLFAGFIKKLAKSKEVGNHARKRIDASMDSIQPFLANAPRDRDGGRRVAGPAPRFTCCKCNPHS